MKKYRHKITGDWVEKSNDHYYKMQSDGRTIPVRLIEGCNDWEEMQVKNLRKPCVIKSVCDCDEPNIALHPMYLTRYCTKCGKDEQTVL